MDVSSAAAVGILCEDAELILISVVSFVASFFGIPKQNEPRDWCSVSDCLCPHVILI
jgi:hypothetical protein